MGMFDWYQPVPPIECPRCGQVVIDEWQGKHGPNALLVWRQGEAAPVEQLVDEELKWSNAERRDFRLPERFDCHSECPSGHYVVAWGTCDTDGTWVAVVQVRAFDSISDFVADENSRR